MKKTPDKRRTARAFCGRWWRTLVARPGLIRWPFCVARYWWERARYQRLPGAERLSIADSYPCLHERTAATRVDRHYFYQSAWVTRRIMEHAPARHVDVGSDNRWVACLTAHVPVTSIDIRPLPVEVENLECRAGSVLELPFDDHSLESISCLHVVEHVGLGRYGDPLDPKGTAKACRELARVVAPGGRLYLSLPVGRPRVCFNAHRVTDPVRVIALCEGLSLVEFSAVDDTHRLAENVAPEGYRDADYACGIFVFERKQDACASGDGYPVP